MPLTRAKARSPSPPYGENPSGILLLLATKVRGRLLSDGVRGLISMGSKKQRASWVPALIKSPDPFAPLQKWQSTIATVWMCWRLGCT